MIRKNSIFIGLFLSIITASLNDPTLAKGEEPASGSFLSIVKKREHQPNTEDESKTPIVKKMTRQISKKTQNHSKPLVNNSPDESPQTPPLETTAQTKAPQNSSESKNIGSSPQIHAPTTGKAQVILKTDRGCYVVSFDSIPGEIISCSENLPITYTKRDCSTSKVLEIADTEAAVSCPEKRTVDLRFKTTDGLLFTELKVTRASQGRFGIRAKYRTLKSHFEEDNLAHDLPSPTLKSIDGEKPEESPIQFKYSGFAWTEFEHSARFGFDSPADPTTARAIPNFNSDDPQATQNQSTFMLNLNLEAKKDSTSLTSLFQVGEIYYGDSASGGAQGTARRGDIFAIRNLYVGHEFNDRVTIRAGRMLENSDPRTFIFSDDIMSAHLAYKSDLSEGQIWYGNSAKSKPGFTRQKNQYLGFVGTLGFLSQIKGTAFALYQQQTDVSFSVSDGSGGYTDLKADTSYLWAGGTFDYDALNPFGVQFTLIGNWGRSKVDTYSDRLNAYLADVRLTYAFTGAPINLTLEGLATSGAENVKESATNPIIGRRKNFVSPIGASYLMTLATSDGADDAPGVPKQSTIANLNQEEGLRILVISINTNLTNKFSAFLRYGHLLTAEKSSSTQSKCLGDEGDIGTVYQLSPSTTFQIDYARFFPGAYYTKHASAELAAAKLKFTF